MRVCASIETEPWSSAMRSPLMVAAGEPSTRVTEPAHVHRVHVGDLAERAGRRRVPATGICSQTLDRVDRRRHRPGASSGWSCRPRA